MVDSRSMLRRLGAALLFLLPACVVNLNDVNGALANGAITGAALDCSTAPAPPGEGAPSMSPAVKFVGRFDTNPPTDTPSFDWSGNYMNARFQGTTVTWQVDAAVPIIFENVIDGVDTAVTIGGKFVPPPDTKDSAGNNIHIEMSTMVPTTGIVTITTKTDGPHEITVMRSSEALFSECTLTTISAVPPTTLLPYTAFDRRIEYIGDSITCGYGDLGNDATCPYDVAVYTETVGNQTTTVTVPKSENIYLAYGSIAARRLAADATTICFSGKGVSVNYREQGVGEGKVINPTDNADPDARTLIPDYYLRTIGTIGPAQTCITNDDCMGHTCDSGMCRCTQDSDCTNGNGPCGPAPAGSAGTGNTCLNKDYQPWDFTKDVPVPQVVFMNLGTNDFSRDVDQNSVADGIDLPKFHDAYLNFVTFVRSKRPDAVIILAVPPMLTDKFPLDNARTDMKNTLDQIVSERAAAGDNNVFEMQLVQMGVRYGLGCDYHPNLDVHRIMADQVVGAIKSKTCWSEVQAQ